MPGDPLPRGHHRYDRMKEPAPHVSSLFMNPRLKGEEPGPWDLSQDFEVGVAPQTVTQGPALGTRGGRPGAGKEMAEKRGLQFHLPKVLEKHGLQFQLPTVAKCAL